MSSIKKSFYNPETGIFKFEIKNRIKGIEIFKKLTGFKKPVRFFAIILNQILKAY